MISIIILLISTLDAQVAPYELSSLKGNYSNDSHHFLTLSDLDFNKAIDINLDAYSHHFIFKETKIIEFLFSFMDIHTIDLNLEYNYLPKETKFFMFDIQDKDIIGPFYIESTNGDTNLGPITASRFILQCIIPIEENNQDHNISIISISERKLERENRYNNYYKKASNQYRENPLIVVTGFWPPTNEMIRHFSQDLSLNPTGWQGEDWQNLGYDIISFFPEFEDPYCTNCGQGYGNFEVDYQDTSNDFWSIIQDLSPISIITFSRGFNDLSWELEYNYYNRTNWYADFTTPFFPTPNPPDSDVPTMFLRNSTLPMEEIVDAINSSDLGLNSFIDLNGDPGHYVSEFMGYHGAWYHDLYQFSSNPCYLAGHVHVGGQIDWDTSREAAEITISKVIEFLDEHIYIPGDANNDENIDILDIVTVISHILGEQILIEVSYYAADINSDGIINIQDIILIINLILET